MEGSVYRKAETHKTYIDKINSGEFDMRFFLKRDPIKDYEHWLLVKNDYPYDQFAGRHCLLFPKREFQLDQEMLPFERAELFAIKKELAPEFDTVMENFTHHRSIERIYHLHFIKFKEHYGK